MAAETQSTSGGDGEVFESLEEAATQLAADMKEAWGGQDALNRYAELMAGHSHSTLQSIIINRPYVPGTKELFDLRPDLRKRSTQLGTHDLRLAPISAWQYTQNAMFKLGKLTSTRPTAEQKSSFFKRMSGVLYAGNPKTVRDKLQAVQSSVARADLYGTLPITLIHCAASAIAERHNLNPLTASREQMAVVDAELRRACADIDGNQEPTKNTSKSPVTVVEAGALAALRACFGLPNSDAWKQELITVLAPICMGMPDAKGVVVLRRQALDQLEADLLAFDVNADINNKYRFTDRGQQVMNLARRRQSEYLKLVMHMQSQLIMINTARGLVRAIMSGDIVYSELCEFSRAVIAHPLAGREDYVIKQRREQEVQRQEQEDRRRAHEARLRDLGWLKVQLNRSSTGELSAALLRPSHHEGATRNKPDTATETTAEKQIKELQDYRLLTLILVQEAMGEPTEIYFRPFKKGRTKAKPSATEAEKQPPASSDGPAAIASGVPPFDPLNADGYIVVVDSQGNAFAERVLKGTGASYLSRHETCPWEEAFDTDKDDAQAHGAVRFQHPDAAELKADYEATVKLYVSMILTELLRDLQSGERLPEYDKIRILSKKVGGVATIFVNRGEI